MLEAIDLVELERALSNDGTPEQRQLALAAASAFNSALRSETVTCASLEPIASVIERGSRRGSDDGAESLWLLSNECPPAADFLRHLARNGGSRTRFKILDGNYSGRVAGTLLMDILQIAICDPLYRVRQKAAQLSETHDMKRMIPLLERQLEQETDRRAMSVLSFCTALLRDGYSIRHRDDGLVTVLLKRSRDTVYSWVSRDEFEQRGEAEILNELRRDS